MSRQPHGALRRSGTRQQSGDGLDVLIVGVGAMACLIGARLARAGVRVALAGIWTAALEAIVERGVILEEPSETAALTAVRMDALDRTGPAPASSFVLVLVKAHQTTSVAPYVGAALDTGGLAVTLQNGLGNRETLAQAVGRERVMAGTTSAGATLIGPGHVRAGGPGETIVGPHGHGQVEASVHAASVLDAAGLSTRIVPDVDPYLWLKLCINAGINPVTALLGSRNEALLNGAPRQAAIRATSEAAAVASACGILLPADPVDAMLTVVARTRANRSSMLQDVGRGAKTEADAITGEVVRHGRTAGVRTPVNDWLLEQVHLLENGGEPQPLEAILEPAHS